MNGFPPPTRSAVARSWLSLALAASLAIGRSSAGEPHPSLPQPVIPDCLGVNIHFTDPKPGELEMLAKAGFKWVRMDFSWGGTERKKGEYDFSAYDRLSAELEKHKLRALFILDYGNPIYDGGMPPTNDETRAAFARWAVEGILHFAGKGYLWEMWNEPNGGFWKPKADVKQYAALARATGEALRDAKLLGPHGEAFIGPATSTIDLAFLEGCFQAGLLEFWDAVSVHPYRQEAPENAEPEYRSLRVLIHKYAPKDKAIPIISGEWGYSDAWHNFTPEVQGKYLPRELLTNIANEIPLSIWYDWHDDGTNPKDPEHHFGIVANEYHAGRDPVYDPKPAYIAMKTLTEQLGGFRFDRSFLPPTEPKVDGDLTRTLLFEKKPETRLAVWSILQKPVHLTLPALPATFKAASHTGTTERLSVAGEGGLAISTTDTPVYLTPEGLNDALGVILAMPRIPLEVIDRAPCIYDPHGLNLHMQWRSIQPDPVDLSLTIRLPGLNPISIAERTYFVCLNPLELEAYPGAASELICRIQNPSGEAFDGLLLLTKTKDHTEIVEKPVQFSNGQKEQMIKLPAPKADDGSLDLVVTGKDEKGAPNELCLVTTLGALKPAQPGFLNSAHVRNDGDAKVESQQSVTAGQPADGAAPPGGDSLRLHYKTDSGWKFFQISTGQNAIPALNEQASPEDPASFPSRFGMWIYGDGQGAEVRARIKDKTGQVFQPSGPRIDWKGWRYVTLPIKSDPKKTTAHWGGAGDGVMHYPIQWDTFFLLDNTSKQPVEGEIYITAPTLIY